MIWKAGVVKIEELRAELEQLKKEEALSVTSGVYEVKLIKK